MLETIKARFDEGEQVIAAVQPDRKEMNVSINFRILLVSLFPAFIIFGMLNIVQTDIRVNGTEIGGFYAFFGKLLLFLFLYGMALLFLYVIPGNILKARVKRCYYVFTNRGIAYNQGSVIRYIAYYEIGKVLQKPRKSGRCGDIILLYDRQDAGTAALRAVPDAERILAALEPYMNEAAHNLEEVLYNFEDGE